MRSHEFVTLEANRANSRLQPKRRGVALIQRVSAGSVGDPVIRTARVSRFTFENRSFKPSDHSFAPGSRFSGSHETLWSAKLNQSRLDGEPYDPAGFALATDVVHARDECSKRQGSSVIGFHGRKNNR